MKELHNHIFSNTTCISKEIMLRYINKQLSKKELHEVEKHMLDCELCTDAFEGMKLAENSSILFAIDNQIDQRVAGGNYKAPIMRNLMVAASVLVIFFGAYFTFDYFNVTIDNGKGLAINDLVEPVQEEILEEKKVGNAEMNIQESTSEEEALIDVLEDTKTETGEKYRVEVNATEQTSEVNGAVSYDMEDEIEEQEVKITANMSEERVSKPKGEGDKLYEALNDENIIEADNRRQDDFSTTLESESVTTSNEAGDFAFNQPETDKSVERLKKGTKNDRNKTRSENNKKEKLKSSNQAPIYYEDTPIEEVEKSKDGKQQKVLVMDTYKIVDYMDEYQNEYDLKNSNAITTKSVSAGYENTEDKDIAEKVKEESIVEVTYKETLGKAIKLYKDKKYTLAIEQFNIILIAHPNEVNGLFYRGLSNYYLQQYTKAEENLDAVLNSKETEFNEEAKWYKALTLIKLNQTDNAKKLLQEIIKTNSFYKTKAEKKLKGL